MFWGLTITGPKDKMAFMSESAIRITNICLEPSSPSNTSFVGFYVITKDGEFLVAQLSNPKCLNTAIDLDIEPEDELMFRIKGEGTLHLTGYELDDEGSESGSDCSGPIGETARHLAGLRLAPVTNTSSMPAPKF